MKEQQYIEDLFCQWINGQATREQEQELILLLGKTESQGRLEQIMDKGWLQLDHLVELTSEQKELITQKALAQEVHRIPLPAYRVHFMRRWGWAAAAILLLAGATYFLTTNKKNSEPAAIAATTTDIAPGKNGAVLTLADGSQIVLDSLENGTVATQNGVQVVLQNGQLAYDPTGSGAGERIYNTMTTPKSRQFQLTLPDGTKVWLNAASSLRYPTTFSAATRRVEVTGEAYFEVAKNKAKPFIVKINNKAEIEVLGTHFNVNAYTNESTIRTTLLEGRVRVIAGDLTAPHNAGTAGATVSALLKPGQQASIPNTISAITEIPISPAQTDQVVAWKNGVFNFEDAGFEEVMRQLERWYDIEVVYEKGIPDIQFGGKLSRNVGLKDLLEILKRTEVHFKLEGERRLVVKQQ